MAKQRKQVEELPTAQTSPQQQILNYYYNPNIQKEPESSFEGIARALTDEKTGITSTLKQYIDYTGKIAQEESIRDFNKLSPEQRKQLTTKSLSELERAGIIPEGSDMRYVRDITVKAYQEQVTNDYYNKLYDPKVIGKLTDPLNQRNLTQNMSETKEEIWQSLGLGDSQIGLTAAAELREKIDTQYTRDIFAASNKRNVQEVSNILTSNFKAALDTGDMASLRQLKDEYYATYGKSGDEELFNAASSFIMSSIERITPDGGDSEKAGLYDENRLEEAEELLDKLEEFKVRENKTFEEMYPERFDALRKKVEAAEIYNFNNEDKIKRERELDESTSVTNSYMADFRSRLDNGQPTRWSVVGDEVIEMLKKIPGVADSGKLELYIEEARQYYEGRNSEAQIDFDKTESHEVNVFTEFPSVRERLKAVRNLELNGTINPSESAYLQQRIVDVGKQQSDPFNNSYYARLSDALSSFEAQVKSSGTLSLANQEDFANYLVETKRKIKQTMINGYGSLLPDQTINDIQFELTPEMLQQELDKQLQFYSENTLEKSQEQFEVNTNLGIQNVVEEVIPSTDIVGPRDSDVVIDERNRLSIKITEERDKWYRSVGFDLPIEQRDKVWQTFFKKNIDQWTSDVMFPLERSNVSVEAQQKNFTSITTNEDNLWGESPNWVMQRLSDRSEFDNHLIKYQAGFRNFKSVLERDDAYFDSQTAADYLINLINDTDNVTVTENGEIKLPLNNFDRRASLKRQGQGSYRDKYVMPLNKRKLPNLVFSPVPDYFPNSLAEYDDFNEQTLTTILHKSLNQRGFTAQEILNGKTREDIPLPGTVVNFRHARIFKNAKLLESHHNAWNAAGQDENGKELPTEEAKARREQTVYGRMLKAMNLPETYTANGRQLWTVDLISTHQKTLFGVN